MAEYRLNAEAGKYQTTGRSVSFTHKASAALWHKKYRASIAGLEAESPWEEFLEPYLFLQIYIEAHLHFALRELYKSAFLDPQTTELRDKWETEFLNTKLELFRKFLRRNDITVISASNLKNFLAELQKVNKTRNQIVHGHELLIADNPNNSSAIGKQLTYDSFVSTVTEAEAGIVREWNEWMDSIAVANEDKNIRGLPTKTDGTDCNYTHLYLKSVTLF